MPRVRYNGGRSDAPTAAAAAAPEDLGGHDNEPVPETGDPPANPPAPTLHEATQEGEGAVANPTATVTVMVMEDGADRPEYLDSVYGNHPHQNDGRHLDGGVANDPFWQEHWKRMAQLPLTLYSVPSGRVGRRFVAKLVSGNCWRPATRVQFRAVPAVSCSHPADDTSTRENMTPLSTTQRASYCDGQARDAAPTTMNLQHGSSTPRCSLVDSAKPYAV